MNSVGQSRAAKPFILTLDGSDVVKKENKSRGMVSRAYPFPLETDAGAIIYDTGVLLTVKEM